MNITAALIITATLLVPQSSDAKRPCVDLQVRPRVMLPMTRGDIRVEIRLQRHEDHRALLLAWDSDTGGAGSSLRDIDGEHDAYLFVEWLKSQPAANYTFQATVFGAGRKILGRAVAEIKVPEGIDR